MTKHEKRPDRVKRVFILWNPLSTLPPTRTFEKYSEARDWARIMARKHPGQVFHVCQVLEGAQTCKPAVEWVSPC